MIGKILKEIYPHLSEDELNYLENDVYDILADGNQEDYNMPIEDLVKKYQLL